jgi:hypothetical protein
VSYGAARTTRVLQVMQQLASCPIKSTPASSVSDSACLVRIRVRCVCISRTVSASTSDCISAFVYILRIGIFFHYSSVFPIIPEQYINNNCFSSVPTHHPLRLVSDNVNLLRRLLETLASSGRLRLACKCRGFPRAWIFFPAPM